MRRRVLTLRLLVGQGYAAASVNYRLLGASSTSVFDAVADVLARNPDIKLEVQGHTDNKGTAEYNLGLSNKRSESVKQYLVSHGIAPGRLTSRGYGLERPIVPNDTEANRALNRRVQFVRTEGTREGCEGTSP